VHLGPARGLLVAVLKAGDVVEEDEAEGGGACVLAGSMSSR
jgi:hypothetical protein